MCSLWPGESGGVEREDRRGVSVARVTIKISHRISFFFARQLSQKHVKTNDRLLCCVQAS